jgi:hypothetical protein
LKKNGGKKYQWGKLDREGGGDKRHGNNSDAIAKKFEMEV